MLTPSFNLTLVSAFTALLASSGPLHTAPPTSAPPPSNTAPAPALLPPPPISDYIREEIAGFSIAMHPSVSRLPQDVQGRLRTVLAYDLETIARTIPAPALEAIRTITIAVTTDAHEMPGYSLHGACFHPSADWLEQHHLSRDREGCVELLNVNEYLDWRAIQPAMVFHELSHAYHWLIGFDRPDIDEAFAAARDSNSLYRSVPHTLNPKGPGQKAYALTDVHEYFAELSEAFFLRNDIFPFVRSELLAYDPRGAAVVEKVWSLTDSELAGVISARRSAANPPKAP